MEEKVEVVSEAKQEETKTKARRGRPRKDAAPVAKRAYRRRAAVQTEERHWTETYKNLTFGRQAYSLDQVRELGILAATTDGKTYYPVKQNGSPVLVTG